MAASRSVILRILGDSRSLQRALSTVDAQGTRTGKSFGLLKKAAGLAAGAAGLYGVQQALSSTINAAKEQELANKRTAAQLKTLGISYSAHKGKIEEVISAQSQLSALDDEDLQDSFTNLVRVTEDVNKALDLNSLAADFARAKGIDVAKAGELIGKVYGGNLGILSRYGITLKDGATATEALGVLQKKFGGQAEAYGNSTAGAQEKFNVALENLQETIGTAVLPYLAKFFQALARGVEWLQKNWPKVEEIFRRVADNVREIWAQWGDEIMAVTRFALKVIVPVIRAQLKLIVSIFKVIGALLRGDWSGAWNAIKDVVRNALGVIRAIITGWFTVAKTIGSKLGSALKDGIVAGVKGLAGALAAIVKAAVNGVISLWNNLGIPGFNINLPGPVPDISFPGVSLPDIPYLDKGGYVSKTGVAVVHRGETFSGVGGGGGRAEVYAIARGSDEFIRFMQQAAAGWSKRNGGRPAF